MVGLLCPLDPLRASVPISASHRLPPWFALSWLYRVRPSVTQRHFQRFKYPVSVALDPPPLVSEFGASANVIATPEQLRFPPFGLPQAGSPEAELDFIEGLRTICGTGSAMSKSGVSIHVYGFGRGMGKRAMYSADGDMLIGEGPESFVFVSGTSLT